MTVLVRWVTHFGTLLLKCRLHKPEPYLEVLFPTSYSFASIRYGQEIFTHFVTVEKINTR
jgi:hypothetical protein